MSTIYVKNILVTSIGLLSIWTNTNAEFYIWYEETGVKHISSIPRECITEAKTVALWCQTSIPVGDPEKVAETKRRLEENERIKNGWAECGEPGKVYIGDTLAIKYLESLADNKGLISSMLIRKVAPSVITAQDKAKETCQDVHLKLVRTGNDIIVTTQSEFNINIETNFPP